MSKEAIEQEKARFNHLLLGVASVGRRNELLKMFSDALAGATHVQGRWISVVLPPPTDGTNVLCINARGKIAIGLAKFRTYPSAEWFCYKSSKTILKNITHWMPLPEKPLI